jgi:5-methylcytosine-specific restriction endonuclease McrA
MTDSREDRLNQVVADARRAIDEREQGYRARALKMYPHICGRCGREFSGRNLRELTVHHRDHDHDNNPSDGSNWELLCLYCHDAEHQKQEQLLAEVGQRATVSTHNPFAELRSMLDKKKE